MIYLVYSIHVLISLFLILVVLLQQGKGADLSVFGGGSTQTAFGARGAATILHKLTVFGFVAFIVTTVTIGLMTSGASTGSVMRGATGEPAPASAPTQPAAVPTPEATTPDTAPATEESSVEDVGPSDEGAPEAETPDQGGGN